MKSKKISQNNKNGFAVIILDLLFIAFGIVLLIIGLLGNQEILKEMTASLVR